MKYIIRNEEGSLIGKVDEMVGRYIISDIKGHWEEHPAGKRYILEEDYKLVTTIPVHGSQEVFMYLWEGYVIIPSC